MTTPRYFRNVKNVDYVISANKAGKAKTIKIKDYFRMMKVREDIFADETLYYEYEVKDGERPDQISYETYGDEQYYWVILQINSITDYYSQWPLSQYELEKYVVRKYGSHQKAGEVHHYETVETFDQEGNLVLPGNLVVPENYKLEYPSYPGSGVLITSYPLPVVNYEYERRINDQKTTISLLNKKYIYDYDREFRNYFKNSKEQNSFISISDVL